MREIKFRCFAVQENEMIAPDDVLTIYDNRKLNESLISDDDHIFEQYTGLKDVNGVEIYEGDIVRIAMDIGATIRAEVMYECGSFWLFSHEIHYVFDEDQDNMIQLGSVCLEGDCYEDGCLKVIDVVGNIHQNREILEGDK